MRRAGKANRAFWLEKRRFNDGYAAYIAYVAYLMSILVPRIFCVLRVFRKLGMSLSISSK